MKNASHRIAVKLAGCTAILAAVLQTVLYLIGYDEPFHLYQHGFMLHLVVYPVVVLFMAAFFVFFCTRKPESLPAELGKITRPLSFFALFSGMLIIAAAGYNVASILGTPPVIPSTIRIFALAMAIPAACYYIISAWQDHPSRPLLTLLCMFVVCWLALYLMAIYFEMDTPLTSPDRILRQLGCALLMVHMLYEVRYLLGNTMPRLYFGTGCAAVIMTGLSALPDAVVTLLQKRAMTDNSMFSLAMTAMGFYIFFRMLTTLRGEGMEFRPEESKEKEIPQSEEAADE